MQDHVLDPYHIDLDYNGNAFYWDDAFHHNIRYGGMRHMSSIPVETFNNKKLQGGRN